MSILEDPKRLAKKNKYLLNSTRNKTLDPSSTAVFSFKKFFNKVNLNNKTSNNHSALSNRPILHVGLVVQ